MVDLDVPLFLAKPTTEATAGVVVVHEGNGMSLQLLRLCERLAREGYVVAAPDLFFRTEGPGAKSDFREQSGAVQIDQMLADLAVAGAALRALGAERLGVTGFCMGGTFAWHAARHDDGYDSAVAFYGARIASDLGQPRCPTLLFFGGSDPWIPSNDIEAVAAHHADTVIYPDAGHGFMRDGSDDYVPEAASDAWARMVGHFRQHLGQAPKPKGPGAGEKGRR
jgi:carboxymethylenebutenolidase